MTSTSDLGFWYGFTNTFNSEILGFVIATALILLFFTVCIATGVHIFDKKFNK